MPVLARIPRKKDVIPEGEALGIRWGGCRAERTKSLTGNAGPSVAEWAVNWNWMKWRGTHCACPVNEGLAEARVVAAVSWNDDVVRHISGFYDERW